MKIAFAAVSIAGIAIGLAMPTLPMTAPAPALAPSLAPALAPATAARRAIDPPTETVIERSDNGHFYTLAEVNGSPTHFVVDTGATMVALTVEDARRAGIAVDPARFAVIGQGASGDVRGQDIMLDSVVLDGKRVSGVRGAVLEGLPVSLLGQSYLGQLETVEINRGTMKLR
ncbi:MAG: hypothetical protein B7Y45_04475 [Sphingomonas sp. 28-66-16]|nr:MAG: hypothetical protein B7Y45_04475 [Sphingomonas sp. 28-66-16]